MNTRNLSQTSKISQIIKGSSFNKWKNELLRKEEMEDNLINIKES
jgi:hypothetical protein